VCPCPPVAVIAAPSSEPGAGEPALCCCCCCCCCNARCCCAHLLVASSRGMGCDLRPASRAAAVVLTSALMPSVLLGALLSCPAPVLLLVLALTPGAWLTSPAGPHAVCVVISCSTRAAAASSTAAGAALLAANERQQSWHSCRACTRHDKRTCDQIQGEHKTPTWLLSTNVHQAGGTNSH
jgi:hypothetical protein